MRIALVSEVSLSAVDGVVTRLKRTLEELQRAGDEVILIAPAGGPSSYAGAPVIGIRPLAMPLYPDGHGYPPKRVSLPGPALARALARARPDVVHAINPVLLAAGAVAVARRQRIPLVASYHAHLPTYTHYYHLGLLEPLAWRYLRAAHNRAQINLCTSYATLRTLAQHRIERLEMWPYGVETVRFHPRRARASWRERLGAGRADSLILLYVGRLAREKSVERLLDAVRGQDRVALAIVGDGPLRRQLEAQFAGTPTTFLGLLTGSALAEAYASADAFVLPSQTETLGIVLLEAHASGLPVIAADSPAARELIRDGIDGLRYHPAEPRSLASAVVRLQADPAMRAAMAREAREAVKHATWKHATNVLRGYYGRARSLAHPGSGNITPAPTPTTVDCADRAAA
jgi:glycosyltransferase involved in cell wall biosynthesis